MKIPDWCIGDAINSFNHEISKEQQAKVRNWYKKNMPDRCELITNFDSNWIGRDFGTKYWCGSSKEWGGFRLCVGGQTYIKLKNDEIL